MKQGKTIALAAVLGVLAIGLVSVGGFLLYDASARGVPSAAEVNDREAFQEMAVSERLIETPEAPEPAAPPPEYIDYRAQGGEFELPVNGATGFTPLFLSVYAEASFDSAPVAELQAGQSFTVIEELGEWWYVESSSGAGWVYHQQCFINLPDVAPSIVYDIANGYASKFVSSGYEIPNITGQVLYQCSSYNARFDREEFVVPVLYSTAKKVCLAQQLAMAEGNTLVIYEAFRPYATQISVVENLGALAASDQDVNYGLTRSPWSMDWFIALGVSNHQKGYAIDVGLASVTATEQRTAGLYLYSEVTGYEIIPMPTVIHELSAASAVFSGPVDSTSSSAWIGREYAPGITDGAIALQRYCTDAGMTPLASEWWHFNDLPSAAVVGGNGSYGDFVFGESFSRVP